MKSIDVLVTFFIAAGIQPQLNKVLQVGFPVPTVQGNIMFVHEKNMH
jgi:hypothetical protein